jgi:ankyrin repeat protein
MFSKSFPQICCAALHHANFNGDTLLHLALRPNKINLPICQLLIQFGLNREAKNNLVRFDED